MSREVRRVPLDWQHPTVTDEHWEWRRNTPYYRSKPTSRLHAEGQRFVGLMDNYPGRLANWEDELRKMQARQGHGWTFAVEYHLTGFKGRDDDEPSVHPAWRFADDGETEIAIQVRDEDHLHELELARVQDEKPDPANYLPVWDTPADDLGWCLYETVSEGTPVTPVFATADELIDHLATVGQDWDQVPMRRTAAEALVRDGSTLGSFVVAGGVLYQSDRDADVIAGGAA